MAKDLFYLGNFSEKIESEEDLYLKEAELFSVGVHRGQEYTSEDLQTLVDSFNSEDDVPLQYDHSASARDTLGFLRAVRVEEGKLLGTVEVIEQSAIDRIEKGLNKKLSISFYTEKVGKGRKPSRIREVSLVAFPQVKDARLFSEEGSNYVSTFDPQQYKEEAKEMELEKMKEELQAQFAEQYAEQIKELDELREKAKTFAEAQVDSKVESFAQEAKIIPAQKDALKALLQSFSEEQAALFDEFMKSQVKLDLNENGEVEEEFGEQTEDKKDEFDEYYDSQVKRFGNAL